MKLGDRVRIAKTSEYYRGIWDRSNPIDSIGTIIYIGESLSLNIQVEWDITKQSAEPITNLYNEKDLELVELIEEYQYIDRSDLEEIFYIVCSDWQEEIIKLVTAQSIFAKTIKIPQDVLVRAYKEADSIQKNILNKYFKDPKVLFTANDLKVGEVMIISKESSSLYADHKIIRIHGDMLVSLTDPNKTWSGPNTLFGEKLESGSNITITTK